MAETITVTLAGQVYTIRRLTLRQLRDLGIGAIKAKAPLPADEVEAECEAFDRFTATVAAGLARDYPEMTVEAIYGLEATLAEVVAASRAILDHAGLVPAGEARAAAASTGDGSTAI